MKSAFTFPSPAKYERSDKYSIFSDSAEVSLYWRNSTYEPDPYRLIWFWKVSKRPITPIFRPDGIIYLETNSRFQMPSPINWYVSPVDPHTIYIALGFEGVLSGPTPWDPGPIPREYVLTRFPELPAPPVPKRDDFAILLAIIPAIFIPPLIFIYSFVLARVFRYIFQPSEYADAAKIARRAAILITLATMIAVIASPLLVSTEDYAPAILFMSCIGVLTCAGTAVHIARKRKFTNRFTRRIGFAAGVIGVFAPLSLTAFWFLWPFIMAGVIGYFLLYPQLEAYLEQREIIMTAWALDRLTFQILMALVLALVLAFAPLMLIVITINVLVWLGPLPLTAIIAMLILLFTVGTRYIRTLLQSSLGLRKKSVPDSGSADASDTLLLNSLAWWRLLFGTALTWVVFGGGAAVIVAFLQLAGIGYLTDLLVRR